MLTGFAVRWWKHNGLAAGQTINTHVEEAAHCETDDGEQHYQGYFHGRLLWTYDGPEVNRYIGWAWLVLSLRVPIYRDEAISLDNRIGLISSGLPAQEGIGHVVNDIPDVGWVARSRIDDWDYVPASA